MERRKAVTAATAASITFLLGAAGLTANATILGARKADGVGTISPVPQRAVPSTAQPKEPSATTAVPTTVPAAAAPAAAPGIAGGSGTAYPNNAPAAPVARSQAPTAPAAPVAPVAQAPAPTSVTAPPVTSTGGSPVAGPTGGGEEHEGVEHEEGEHEEGEHEGVEHEGGEDDD